MERQNVVEVVKSAFEGALNNLVSLLNEIDKDSEIRKETKTGRPIRHIYEAQITTFFLLELLKKTKLEVNAIRVERPYRELKKLNETHKYTYCDICLKFDGEVWIETKFLTTRGQRDQIVKDIVRLQRVKGLKKDHRFLMIVVSKGDDEKLIGREGDWTMSLFRKGGPNSLSLTKDDFSRDGSEAVRNAAKSINNTVSMETQHFENTSFHGYLIELKL